MKPRGHILSLVLGGLLWAAPLDGGNGDCPTGVGTGALHQRRRRKTFGTFAGRCRSPCGGVGWR